MTLGVGSAVKPEPRICAQLLPSQGQDFARQDRHSCLLSVVYHVLAC